MATVIRNTDPILSALCTGFNALKAQIGAGTSFHLDVCEHVPSSASATDLPSAIVRLQELIGIYNFHIVDTLALKAADTTNTLAYTAQSCAAPTSGDGGLASAIAAANDLHTKYTAHLSQSGVHFNNDATNTDASSSATDLPSLETRVNDLFTALKAHIGSASAPSNVAPSLRVTAA